MSLKNEITEAIAAHDSWKHRLHDAVETGSREGLSREIGADDQCEFGRWLYGTTIPTAMKASPGYLECRDLHAAFHVAAARAFAMATSGHKLDAEADMDHGAFEALTHELIAAMHRWQAEFRLVCAWCGTSLRESPDPDAPVSHGICGACSKRAIENALR